MSCAFDVCGMEHAETEVCCAGQGMVGCCLSTISSRVRPRSLTVCSPPTQGIGHSSCDCFWCGQLAKSRLCILLPCHQLRQPNTVLEARPSRQRQRLLRSGHKGCGELLEPAATRSTVNMWPVTRTTYQCRAQTSSSAAPVRRIWWPARRATGRCIQPEELGQAVQLGGKPAACRYEADLYCISNKCNRQLPTRCA
jgi:hypothetical protein